MNYKTANQLDAKSVHLMHQSVSCTDKQASVSYIQILKLSKSHIVSVRDGHLFCNSH